MQQKSSVNPFQNLFVTGGGMGKLIRDYNWPDSKLGDVVDWPQSLQSALSICLNSNFPIAIYWGKDLVLLYNDAWSPIPGNKHPWALGKPAIEVWPEIWPDIEPQFQKAFSGIPGGSKDALLPMQRHGYTEECYFDFTFTPIYGASGQVEGIFNAVIETTYRVINERRLSLLQRLSDAINSVSHPEEVFIKAGTVLNAAEADLSFYSIVEFEKEGGSKIKVCSPGFDHLNKWPLDEARKGSFRFIENISAYGIHYDSVFWPEPPSEAVIIPLKSNDGKAFGCIIAGLSSRRKFDKDYRSFFESLATIIAGELNTIKSLSEERKRAQALAEIDKAKTTFFNNISHEFRTPLTLMIGPLENVLAKESLNEEEQEELSTAYRNTLRLQKLVNMLLDFSRIEAGKMEAKFESVDAGKYTADLASSFRSAVESAGLEYNVKMGNLSQPVLLDTDMWEKIVLNLISNAFKYTKSGKIEVTIEKKNKHLVLVVEDTGAGISKEDQPKIFERFYRINNSEGRSQEGSGIGLAMVKELVQLHQGEISVESEQGKGSKFIVKIPAKEAAILQNGNNSVNIQGNSRSQYIEEAKQWTERNYKNNIALNKDSVSKNKRPHVLVADDNSDMRAYVQRLLADDFNVVTAVDGEEAYKLAIQDPPDLVLADIMMPRLDGFGLLQKLKSTLVTRNIPVIFLSARAGEEAKVEGITAGADDYLVKPFSAKELVARVSNHVLISRIRRKTEKEFFNLFMQAPAHIHVMKGPDHLVEFFHPLGKQFLGGRDITGKKIREAVPELEGQGYFEMLDQVYNEGKEFYLPESKAFFKNDKGVVEEHYFNITYLPLRDFEGKIEGVLQFTIDVTQQARANQQIRDSEERFRLLVTSIPQIVWISDTESNIEFLSEQWEAYTHIPIEEGRQKFSSFIHPDDIGIVRAKWHEALKLKESWRSEFRLINAVTGEYRWFLGHTVPLKNENGDVIKWIGSASDIHAQKTANERLEALIADRTSALVDLNEVLSAKNEELSRAQNFLQTVLDSSVEMVTAFDNDLNFTFVNKRVIEFSNRLPEDLIGKNLMDIVPDIKESEGYGYLLRALNGETVQLESKNLKSDSNKIFETFIIPLKRNDTITGVVTMQRDITAIIKLTENLKLSNSQLKRSNDDLQQFAHVTSHDLKEPVRKIKMFGNLLRTDYSQHLPEKGNEYLQKIERATNRISTMIDGILQYSSIEGIEENFEPVDINGLVKSIVDDLELVIQEADAKVQYDKLPVVNGSPTLLNQLFYNLLNNSLKFRSKERRPVISITSGEENINGYNFVRIDMSDNGIGFNQSFAERIFDSFSRLNSKDKYEGTGLGLALCKKIVLRHGGFIHAKGEENKGATFSVFLPVES